MSNQNIETGERFGNESMQESRSSLTDVADDQTIAKKKKNGPLIIILVVITLIAVFYLVVSVFFMKHYYFRTYIDDTDYSFQNKEQVLNQILNADDSQTITLIGRGEFTDEISAKDFSLAYVYDDTLQLINNSQNGFAWYTALFMEHNYNLPKKMTYDKDALEKAVRKTVFFHAENIKKPQNAQISSFDETEDKFTVVSEDLGAYPMIDRVMDSVLLAMTNHQETLRLDEKGCYENPEITDEEETIQKTVDEMNQYVKAKITYDWNGNQLVVDGKLIQQWLEIKEDEVTLREDAVAEYVNQLADTYDTYGKNRIFKTTSGNDIELASGSYGWKTDREQETKELIAAIKEGKEIQKEPVYLSKGYVKGTDDIGNSYVEINLSAQHLYLYKDAAIVLESDLVSGNVSNGCTTPQGVFGLTYKQKEAILRGEDYETKVHYWMPFNRNIGMHDAIWRSNFGGDIYLTSGSHGCINLPLESAAAIFDYISKGYPVVCYY